MDTFDVKIDGRTCQARAGETILTVARRCGIEIPTLCHHQLVKIYGSCGVCLVEVEGSNKLMRACATVVNEGMSVNTRGQRAEAGRRLSLELMLSDHRGDCRPPCSEACPAGTDCQGYAGLIANGEYREAVKLIKEMFPLPASIGRVCPHPCETACRRNLVDEPVSIGNLKRFVGDVDLFSDDPYQDVREASTGKSVAIVGGGPSGLTAAYYLARHGHRAEIFEAMPKAGGMLQYGIPQYRLPKEVLDREIDLIRRMGVEIHCNTKIGRDIMFEDIEKKFDAVYIAIGAWRSTPVGCPGEGHEGVFGGIDFLRDAAQKKPTGIGRRVAVVGGGNTAMDACRTAVRLGAEKVYIIYRRTIDEMPAEKVEIDEAAEEGVDFRFLVSPINILAGADGRVCGIELQKMQLGEPDASGRRSPVPVPGETEALDVDTVIAAAGQSVVPDGIPVKLTKKNTIEADEFTFLTDRKGVFAGGDGVNKGPGIAIAAIGHASKAADVIDSYLKGDVVPYCKPYIVTRDDMTEEDYRDRPRIPRAQMAQLPPEERRHDFSEVALGLTEEQARADAARCLECGCADYFECKLIKYGRAYDVHPARLGGTKRRREFKDEHPFIERNADKCILCGLCVRVCEEVVGLGVYGLVNRGFETIIKPEFGVPLRNTECISCGECANLCPTGALTELWTAGKRVPLREDAVNSVCGYCSVGCKTVVTHRGDTVCRVLPADGGLMCSIGSFGYGVQQKDRLTTALVGGKQVPLDKAAQEFRDRMADVYSRFGKNSIGVALSDALTSEEMRAVKSLAADTLHTDVIGCLNKTPSAVSEVFGRDASSADYTDIEKADLIIYAGHDIMKTHAALGMKIRGCSAKIYTVSDCDSLLGSRVSCNIKAKALEGIAASVAAQSSGCTVPGYSEFAAAFPDRGCEFAHAIAKEYMESSSPLIVYDEQSVSYDAALLLCNIARISGKNKVLPLGPRCNSQGLSDEGIGGREKLEKAMPGLRALFIIGEDMPELDTSGLEFLVVADTHLTDTAQRAEIVLPLASFLEKDGTYVDAEGRIGRVRAAVSPKSGISNLALFSALGAGSGTAPEEFVRTAGPQREGRITVPAAGAPVIVKATVTDRCIRAFKAIV